MARLGFLQEVSIPTHLKYKALVPEQMASFSLHSSKWVHSRRRCVSNWQFYGVDANLQHPEYLCKWPS
jgi:hypothetical protein